MSIESFDALPWKSICYAAITVCCIAVFFKHCLETAEKILHFFVLSFAALGIYISWSYVDRYGWETAWQLLIGKIPERVQEQIKEAPAVVAQGAFQFLNNLFVQHV